VGHRGSTQTLYYLAYGGSQDLLNEDLNIFTDADWANDPDRKSVSGYVITLAGGAVSWASKKQATIALSTAEAEYIAAAHVAKQVLWHKHLFEELSVPVPSTLTIFSDNQAAVAIGHHPEFHARTKHIDLVYHFLQDLISCRILNMVYIRTHLNLRLATVRFGSGSGGLGPNLNLNLRSSSAPARTSNPGYVSKKGNSDFRRNLIRFFADIF
jgi:hypothetical protein